MSIVDVADILGSLVTALGLPFAIFLFWQQRRKDRLDEEAIIYESLASSYEDFLRLVLENPDLKLWTKDATTQLDDEQQERLTVLFELLVSLFERAYILTYATHMSPTQKRLWPVWNNYMRQWCAREDFRNKLDRLIEGDDAEFSAYITAIAKQAAATAAASQ